MHSLRHVLAALLVAVLGASLARAEVVVTAPAALTFKLGALQLAVVRDGAIAEPNTAKVFGLNVGPAAVAQVLTQAGAADDVITMSTDILMVRTPGHVVLFDAGFGPKFHGVLLSSLAQVGVAPGDVTDIFITHSHFDHTGGLTGADGKPAFPKAVVRLSAREWAFVQSNPITRAQMAAVAGQVKTFEPGQPVLPGITPIALYGHTPGSTGYRIASQGQTLLATGDVVHSSIVSLARPDWAEGYDNDKVAGAVARRTELEKLAASGELVFVPHFPFPGVGRIEADGAGFRWKPEASLAH